jgi:enediyne biosynthesis protein E4
MNSRTWILALLLCGCHSEEGKQEAVSDAPSMAFVDATDSSGLAFTHNAGITEDKHLPETMGSGAAVGDFNEDGHLDIYLVQSGPLPFAGSSRLEAKNALWLGDGTGKFTNHTGESGDASHDGYGMGVALGDYDLDGHLDLFVTNLGPDVLLRGRGDGSFEDVTRAAGIEDSRWTAGSTFFDGDGDGDLDLYVTAYVEYDLLTAPYCGDRKPGWRSYCHPDQFPGLTDKYWRNEGDGTFVDATLTAGFVGTSGKGLGAMASDLDGDGDLDLYVANDSVENRLWLGDGAGNFEDGTLFSGTGVNGYGLTEAGMGIAIADFDDNGLADIFVTNFDDESNTLYQNDGDGFFTDTTSGAGLDAASRQPVGFGTVALDVDDDGDLDLAVVNGHIIDNIHLYNDGKRWAQHALLFENVGGGHFRNASESSGDFAREARVGRGLYTGDFDEDGDLDLLATENNGPARIFLKQGAAPGAVFLHGLQVGTQVRFTLAGSGVRHREAGPQISYFGACSPAMRIGAGEISELDVMRPGMEPARCSSIAIKPGHYRVVFDGTEARLVALP